MLREKPGDLLRPTVWKTAKLRKARRKTDALLRRLAPCAAIPSKRLAKRANNSVQDVLAVLTPARACFATREPAILAISP